ncbi:hypothetical protein HMPREF1433_00300 [Helicobacter pylori GAMchJs117Ai]|nr:hypothetical protein HMPREF1433_00300 [Helicobacter pylori GAMchJs117Ai]
MQRFLNLSFQVSFCCKTLKGVGDLQFLSATSLKPPNFVHYNEIIA